MKKKKTRKKSESKDCVRCKIEEACLKAQELAEEASLILKQEMQAIEVEDVGPRTERTLSKARS